MGGMGKLAKDDQDTNCKKKSKFMAVLWDNDTPTSMSI